MSLTKLREQYATYGLSRQSVDADPFVQFALWLKQARDAGLVEAEAMAVATVSAAQTPSLRHVLMKKFDPRGFVFFTNYASRKAQQLQTNQSVAAVFPWIPLQRQVIIEGEINRISAEESAEYFHSRPRAAQIGAWASRQSEKLNSRAELEKRNAKYTEKFGEDEIPLPDFWGGYRIAPLLIEFWQGRHHRLHDRILYTRATAEDSKWSISRLSP